MEKNTYDVIIIGAGPAGLSAGLYASRAKLKTLIIEKNNLGGLIFNTNEVVNYPGSIKDATGPSLVERMIEQADGFGVERAIDNIVEVIFDKDIKVLKGENNEYYTKAVIIASGASPKKIGCPGEVELTGRGISYCATCDANFFTGLEVFVVGGGDAAIEEAIYLTKFARKVTVVHRRDKLRAAKSIQEKAFNNEKIEFKYNSVVKEIKGEGVVESIVFKNTVTNEEEEYKADDSDGIMGVFVFIGYQPNIEVFKDIINIDNSGYIITDEDMKTNKEGIFAAGDIRVKSLRQVVTAAADGAIAAVQAEKYIENKFE